MIDSQIRERSRAFQMCRWQLVLRIGELEWLIIQKGVNAKEIGRSLLLQVGRTGSHSSETSQDCYKGVR